MNIKKFWQGKELYEVYPYATRFQVIKYRIRHAIWVMTRTASVIALVFASYWAVFFSGKTLFPNVVYAERQVMNDSLDKRIGELQDDVLTTLEKCESAGHKETDGIIVFDANNRASIGTFQFQKATVQHYYKTLYGQSLTAKDAVIIALDAQKARELAKDIIFKTDKGLTNWINCDKKFNLSQRVKFIEEL